MISKNEKKDIFYIVVENKGLTPTEISRKTGLDRGNISKVLNRKMEPSENLLTRFGEEYDVFYDNFDYDSYTNITQSDEYTGNEASLPKAGVPYFEDIEGTAGITTSYSDFKEMPTFYIDYEHFNDCTAYVPIVGDSMYPAFCSGEIIAIKKVFNLDVILWGEAYFVVTNGNANDIRAAKLLFPHDEDSKIILRSSNPNYKGDTVINKKDILQLYLIKGKIHRKHL